ncbi:MAG: hypothetical protein AB2602_06285, partial [Candidatus Thiodiazotropha sp.]
FRAKKDEKPSSSGNEAKTGSARNQRPALFFLRRPDCASLRPKEVPLGCADGATAASMPLLRKKSAGRF